jgi:hypothetical protein
MLQWAGKKFKEIHYVHKGMNCLTEMYSAIAADVPIESDPTTQKDPKLIKTLLSADRVSVSYFFAEEHMLVYHSVHYFTYIDWWNSVTDALKYSIDS